MAEIEKTWQKSTKAKNNKIQPNFTKSYKNQQELKKPTKFNENLQKLKFSGFNRILRNSTEINKMQQKFYKTK